VFSRRDLRRRHIKRKHPEAVLTEGSSNPQASSSLTHLSEATVSESRSAVPQNGAGSTSADDFTSLFGENMMDSFGGSQMSIEELLSGSISGPSRTSENGASGKLRQMTAADSRKWTQPQSGVSAAINSLRPIFFHTSRTSHLLSTSTCQSGHQSSYRTRRSPFLRPCSTRLPLLTSTHLRINLGSRTASYGYTQPWVTVHG
jgi:hypothetical protein